MLIQDAIIVLHNEVRSLFEVIAIIYYMYDTFLQLECTINLCYFWSLKANPTSKAEAEKVGSKIE